MVDAALPLYLSSALDDEVGVQDLGGWRNCQIVSSVIFRLRHGHGLAWRRRPGTFSRLGTDPVKTSREVSAAFGAASEWYRY